MNRKMSFKGSIDKKREKEYLEKSGFVTMVREWDWGRRAEEIFAVIKGAV